MPAVVPELQTATGTRAVEGSGAASKSTAIVLNYDATIVPFDEGDVVSGKVVRIDQDEVLVDIGYGTVASFP